MFQLATIFEKIKEDFFENQIKNEDREKYGLIFSPFSTGFTYDDFLFLDSNSASENAQKYMDELLEFSQIANTIPKEKNYWTISDQQDYLFFPYGNIVQTLKLIDVDTLNTAMLCGHPIFEKALSAIGGKSQNTYRMYHLKWTELMRTRDNLLQKPSSLNQQEIEAQLKENQRELEQTEAGWKLNGNKEQTEIKVLGIIKDEFKRFLNKLVKTKGQLETLVRTHAGTGSDFYLTSCTPNNLYKGDDFMWKKITIGKEEIHDLLEKMKTETYNDIIDSEELSDLAVESISFELLFASITRAWFDETLLESPFWDINILSKEDIAIPRFTSKLIFIRNVEFQAPEALHVNKELVKSVAKKSAGPFIIDSDSLDKTGKFKLHSVNKALNLDRHTVLDVGAKLNRKRKSGRAKPVVNQKRKQFVALAGRVRSLGNRKPLRSRPIKKTARSRAVPSTSRRITSIPRAKTAETASQKKAEQESFQLIGVVSKELEAFPTPIKNADYV
ncbi:hypothetical protein [Flagellimonas meridianipacifica]|uniref:Uncharacterized protein n=1 Tax=Flagellimonas meridianipacifica TaxID=1080225 RepID=A0A2T0M8F2_9FLAO|nr:hypothetical protein [Allomuricauda pacifica]PRX53781.1 hypothetical protein CLV81_2168 [Allomuricauda pacifica]